MRAIGYTRVSTDEQAREGVSLDSQADKIAAYCGLYGLELVETITDPGESSKTLDRPGIQRALAMLDDGQVYCVVVVKLDRLTRSVSDWQYLIDQYFSEKAGKRLCSVNDSIDTHTASGRLVLNVLMSVAQWEREAIAERTRDALQHKIRKGERCGRVRYGYTLGADGKTLVPDAREQDVVTRMQLLRANKFSYRVIAATLNDSGILARGDRPWSHSTVQCILERGA